MTRQERRELLAHDVKACRRCPGLNVPKKTEAAPGWGSIDSPVMLVGQSLCEQCMEPQEPFYEGSGSLLDEIFEKAGCHKADLFITNAVHCHPPRNRPSDDLEIVNCSTYLYRELDLVRPRLIIGLGGDAKRVLTFICRRARELPWPFEAPRNMRSKTMPSLIFAKHPSWVKRQHRSELETEYVNSLSDAISWAMSRGPFESSSEPTIEPTCGGMVLPLS
ncbi:uracil-DNA glycosylase [Mycolicibacterium sp. 018/SC-01/001]|uniref:uracil-DNA glycosylase n=1 Tax=Mycolicibacterium sp. 018/SC-01/001 TaxID=2592069 RepID=UPI00117F7F34|nr:uracil-DNA glycosylase family protein [Mycolicibacterium sp. 018/SC-01/001]TRW86259.1 uracil-DNA glycosylase [Mycolicibacterium sp. 018/SC-01/001]